MKKKRLTAAQKKIAELTDRLERAAVDHADYRGIITDREEEITRLKATIKDKDNVIKQAQRVLSVVANHNDYAPDNFWLKDHRRGEMLSNEDNLLSLAIAAVTKLSEYKGKETKQYEVELNARLSTINLGEERKQIIRLAVEQSAKYIVQTDPKTGMLQVFSRENQGGRSIL